MSGDNHHQDKTKDVQRYCPSDVNRYVADGTACHNSSRGYTEQASECQTLFMDDNPLRYASESDNDEGVCKHQYPAVVSVKHKSHADSYKYASYNAYAFPNTGGNLVDVTGRAGLYTGFFPLFPFHDRIADERNQEPKPVDLRSLSQ